MNNAYEKIPLPECLDETIKQACARAAKEEKRRRRFRWMGIAAAACVVLVATVNVPQVGAALSEVPVIGSLVRVLQIGDSGERTDGAAVIGSANEDGFVRLSFQRHEGISDDVPAFTVRRYDAPDRMVLTLNGVRSFDLAAFEDALSALPQVSGYYRETVLDDSAMRLAIELAPSTGYHVSQYRKPGYLDINFLDDPALNMRPVYFLRSDAMPMSESLALLAEMYSAQDASIAQTQTAEQYTVQIGAFDTRAEAESLLSALGNPAEFWIDSCQSDQRPQ